MREVGGPGHASTEQLSALLDDRAEPGEVAFLEEHLRHCARCAEELHGLRTVRDLLRSLPVHLPPRSFTISVPEPRQPNRLRRLVPLTRALGALAAVLCVVLFSLDAISTADMPTPVSETGNAMLTAAPTRSGPAAAPGAASEAAPARAAQAPAAAAAPPPAPPAPAGQDASKTADAGAAREAAPGAAEAPSGRNAALAARPAEPAAAPATAPKSGAPAARAAPTPTAAAATPPAAPQATVTAFGAAQPTAVAAAPTVVATPISTPGVAAAVPRSAEQAPAPAAPAAQRQASAERARGLTPLRAASLALGLAAAALLIGSFVLARLAVAGAEHRRNGRLR